MWCVQQHLLFTMQLCVVVEEIIFPKNICLVCCYTNVLSTIKLSIFIFHLFMVFFGLEVFYCFNIIHQDACSDFEVVASFEFILLCKVMSYVHKYIQDIISFLWLYEENLFILILLVVSFSSYKINKNHLQKNRLVCMWIWQSMHWDLLYNLFSFFCCISKCHELI